MVSVRRLALVGWIGIASLLSSCDTGSGSPNCVNIDGIAEAMTWSSDGSHVAVAGSVPAPFVARIDATGMQLTDTWRDDRMTGTTVALDADDHAYWLATGPDADAVWTAGDDGKATRVASLPDPLTFGLFWTARGWRVLRWSGSGLPGQPPGERWSLVEATIDEGVVTFGRVVYESSDPIEAWLAPDGDHGVLLLQRAVGRPIAVIHISAAGQDEIGSFDGVSSPSMPDVSRVLVRRASDGGLVYVDSATGEQSLAAEGEYLRGVASPQGAIATAAAQPGGRTEVCVLR